MERQTIDLGFILKHFNIDFSMETLENRRWLQHFIYILQIFDIYLGYEYSWRMRGPYDSRLAECGFALKNIYHEFPTGKTKFDYFEQQKQFKKFQKFVKNRETDAEFLEIVSTLHSIKHDNDVKDSDIVSALMRQSDGRFTDINKCQKILKEMKKWKLIQ